MKTLLFALTALLATATLAQTPGYPQSSSPAQTMPEQRVPSDQTSQGQEPMETQSSPAQVEQEIQEAFQAQPTLANSHLSATANNSSVVVKGTVADENQHQMALRVAALHANGLRIVDRIQVQQ